MDKRLLFVLFLTVLMAGISHQQQQYRYQHENPSRSLWVPEMPIPPSFARRMMEFLYSNYRSPNNEFYDDGMVTLMSPSSQQEGDMVDIDSINEESSTSQSRKNVFSNRNNIKPSTSQTQQEQLARFAFPFRQTLFEPTIQAISTFSNNMRTATFTITLNVTTAIITTCIPLAAFAAAPPNAQNIICPAGRKRRDIEAVEHDIDENPLADIVPSRVEVLIATADPNSVANKYEGNLHGRVQSSKEENELIGKIGYAPSVQRDKRFLLFDGPKNVYGYYPVTTTTVTSYSFASTTCTQQLQFIAAALACRPSQLSVCA